MSVRFQYALNEAVERITHFFLMPSLRIGRVHNLSGPETRTLRHNLLHQILNIFLLEHLILHSSHVRLQSSHVRLQSVHVRLHGCDVLFECGHILGAFGSVIVLDAGDDGGGSCAGYRTGHSDCRGIDD